MSSGDIIVYNNVAQAIQVTLKENGAAVVIDSGDTVIAVVTDLEGNAMFTQKTIDISSSPHADTDLANGVVVLELTTDDAATLSASTIYKVFVENDTQQVYGSGEKTLKCVGAWPIT